MGEGTGFVQSRGEPGPAAVPSWGFAKATSGSCLDVAMPEPALGSGSETAEARGSPGARLYLGHPRSGREGFWASGCLEVQVLCLHILPSI